MEELIRSKNQVADQLREEGEKIVNEASTQIIALKSEVFCSQQDLDSLLSEKCLLDTENERLGPDARQIQFQMENEIHNLASKIEEQQKILKEKEDTIKAVRHHLLDSSNHRPLDSPKYRPLESP
ncbi:hypothetical protein OIU85_025928 [Salix viminalis]|uniref:Uncharacterized protein n=1 Tax=Salix viminalis TaxID=40686 RepID=A0A9Q0YYA0_SALVM|nr:hypothetical protein OIU85_025928 [Salix viminalis]